MNLRSKERSARTFALLSILYACASGLFVQNCSVSLGGHTFDLSNLRRTEPPDIILSDELDNLYYFNVCAPTIKVCNGNEHSFLSVWSKVGECFGSLVPASSHIHDEPHYRFINEHDEHLGIRVTFLNNLTQKGYVHLLIYCEWDTELKVHQAESVAEDVNLVFSSRHGCFREFTDDGQRNQLLLISLSLFLVLFLYCSVRAVFNIMWRAATGWDVLPHIELVRKRAGNLSRELKQRKEKGTGEKRRYEAIDNAVDFYE